MFPLVNDKSLLNCAETDLQQLLGNPDFRENDMLDYKVNFSLLECDKGSTDKENKRAEFCSDVCAFANAFGGFLIYGISEEKGVAKEIVGVNIADADIDTFESHRKNDLSLIMPKLPPIQFRFIPLQNTRYVVIIHVRNDSFTPYVHMVKHDYRVLKRVNNGKQSVNYLELKQMFNQSLSLNEAIEQYRKDRILHYRSMDELEDQRYSRFYLLHIIPDTFRNSSDNRNMFIIEKKEKVRFSSMFSVAGCNTQSIPNVDGLKYIQYNGLNECQLSNNGIVELFYPLTYNITVDPLKGQHLHIEDMWDIINDLIQKYTKMVCPFLYTTRLYIGISIIGCKGLITDDSRFDRNYIGSIDRNMLICDPILFSDISDEGDIEKSLKLLEVYFTLSIGIKNSSSLQEMIKEL